MKNDLFIRRMDGGDTLRHTEILEKRRVLAGACVNPVDKGSTGDILESGGDHDAAVLPALESRPP